MLAASTKASARPLGENAGSSESVPAAVDTRVQRPVAAEQVTTAFVTHA
jgi:hypothetical protein